MKLYFYNRVVNFYKGVGCLLLMPAYGDGDGSTDVKHRLGSLGFIQMIADWQGTDLIPDCRRCLKGKCVFLKRQHGASVTQTDTGGLKKGRATPQQRVRGILRGVWMFTDFAE